MFVLIERPALQAIALPAMARGATVTAAYRTAESTVSTSRLVDGRSLPRALFIDGEQVVGGRLGSIPAPAGGAVVDVEARTAMAQILAALRTHGLIEA
jgi:hypothetical protein